jgi:hypothetical protein
MDIPDILKDLSPLLIILLISFLKSRKPKEVEEDILLAKHISPPPPPVADIQSHPASQECLQEAFPMELVCGVPTKKKKSRSIKEMVIAQVVLDRPRGF